MKWTVLCVILLAAFSAQAQTGTPENGSPENDSTFYVVDSVAVGLGSMHDLSPEKIASISVVSGAGVVRKYGERAANGVIYIETKVFARKHYTALFANSSAAYKQLLTENKGDDTHFAYVLNGRLLTINPEGELSAIQLTELRAISVMQPKDLQRIYGVKDKVAGVLITTSTSSGAAHGGGGVITAK
ncbi:hypothetical protein GA0116948_104101 [Chitinophaga costaii]|uniref:TonB-dependent receptor plug domain-containing protein n=1 Tax=Chitinophaga costaii TaxID=1335309 RepID=A0A1C4CFI8_9BACT|nr:hypothetical protein [Chitinophaga costaii]PUZ27109.1 hypothetical protein DCM91_07745 [Chitinophaga costaii]SCC17855.1 hypothetical protein GA0116948_104101 [Chitinophaga costaii]